jgi:uncharacterized protein YutE (UPF0331/DUF86 family)
MDEKSQKKPPKPNFPKATGRLNARQKSASFISLTQRWKDSRKTHRLNAPTQVVEMLERNGIVTHESARRLRALIKVRNWIVHGDLSRKVLRRDVSALIKQVRALLPKEGDKTHQIT